MPRRTKVTIEALIGRKYQKLRALAITPKRNVFVLTLSGERSISLLMGREQRDTRFRFTFQLPDEPNVLFRMGAICEPAAIVFRRNKPRAMDFRIYPIRDYSANLP